MSHPHPTLKPGEACCCGYKAPPPPAPKVNNIQVLATQFCCGMSELGNFNYVDPPGGKRMSHYHRIGGGWATQQNQAPSTKEDIESRMKYQGGAAIICTTGAGQEYLDDILPTCGFTHVASFMNPGHANTPVKLWVFIRHPVKEK